MYPPIWGGKGSRAQGRVIGAWLGLFFAFFFWAGREGEGLRCRERERDNHENGRERGEGGRRAEVCI